MIKRETLGTWPLPLRLLYSGFPSLKKKKKEKKKIKNYQNQQFDFINEITENSTFQVSNKQKKSYSKKLNTSQSQVKSRDKEEKIREDDERENEKNQANLSHLK